MRVGAGRKTGARRTGRDHPGRDAVQVDQDRDGVRVGPVDPVDAAGRRADRRRRRVQRVRSHAGMPFHERTGVNAVGLGLIGQAEGAADLIVGRQDGRRLHAVRAVLNGNDRALAGRDAGGRLVVEVGVRHHQIAVEPEVDARRVGRGVEEANRRPGGGVRLADNQPLGDGRELQPDRRVVGGQRVGARAVRRGGLGGVVGQGGRHHDPGNARLAGVLHPVLVEVDVGRPGDRWRFPGLQRLQGQQRATLPRGGDGQREGLGEQPSSPTHGKPRVVGLRETVFV